MAKLAAVLDTLDGVSEAVREFYTEVDGRFVLDADVETHPGTEKLRKTASARKREREAVEEELKAFKELGATPEELRDLKKKLEAKPKEGEPEDLERRIEKRVAEVKKEFEPIVTELEAMKAENRMLKLTDKVRAAFIAAGGIEEDADLVLKDTESRFDLDEKSRVVVLDDERDPTGHQPQEWFEKVYKKSRPKFFKGTGAAGGGSTGGGGGSAAPDELAKLPPAERLSRARELGSK